MMDWSRIKRKTATDRKSPGPYTNLDELVRIQFKAVGFSLLPRQPVTSILSGRYASRLRGRGLNFEELRRYQAGDDIRTMDWKATARTNSPHVRIYTEEKDRVVLLIVDQRLNMFFGTRTKLKSVTAAELAAIGAWRAIGVGDPVGAIVFNDSEIVEIPPQRSQRTVMSILGAIVRMNHQLSGDSDVTPNGAMLNKVLTKVRRLVSHDALVVLISDFFGIDHQTEHLTADLAGHNDVLAFLPFDPIRVNPGYQRLTLGDGKLQMEVDLGDTSKRENLIACYQAEQDHITHFLGKISAPLLMINNAEDVAEQVRKYLGVTPRLNQS